DNYEHYDFTYAGGLNPSGGFLTGWIHDTRVPLEGAHNGTYHLSFFKGVIFADGTVWHGDGTIEKYEPTLGYEYDLAIDVELTGEDAADGSLSDITLTLDGIEADNLSGLLINGEEVSFIDNEDGTVTITLPENVGTSLTITGKVTTETDDGGWSVTANVEALYEGEVVADAESTATAVGGAEPFSLSFEDTDTDSDDILSDGEDWDFDALSLDDEREGGSDTTLASLDSADVSGEDSEDADISDLVSGDDQFIPGLEPDDTVIKDADAREGNREADED